MDINIRAICVASLVVFGNLTGSAARAGDTPISAPTRTDVTRVVKVSLLRVGGLPAVAASVDGSKPYPFILDWAANLFAINPARARTLDLPTTGTDEMGNPKMSVADLSIAQAHFKGLTAAADPFLNGRLEAGVLGVNVFRATTVTIDLARNTFTVDAKALPSANGRDVFRYQKSPGGAPMISIKVCGVAFWANIDTAAPAAVRLPSSMIGKLACQRHKTSDAIVTGAQSGQTGATDVRIDGDVRVGDVTIQHPVVRFGDGPAIFVGDAILNRLVVSLDQRHQLIRIVKSTAPIR